MEYDAAGHMVKRQTPEMAAAGEYLAATYDMLGRPTELDVHPSVGPNQPLYSLTYDSSASIGAGCDAPMNTNGRLLKRKDSFGETWYKYDSLGRITEEIRLRVGVTDCSTADPQDIQNTFYAWSSNGQLTSIRYPFGRTVTYSYGTGGATDRVTGVSATQFNGSSWSVPPGIPLISGVVWEPYGGLRAYIVDDQSACAPTYVNYRHIKPGASTDPHTGLLGSLTVGSTETGSEFYRRDYTWQADQVVETDTYLLGATTPRTEIYSYDALLRLTGVSAPNFAIVGGAVGSRAYAYDSRGNRTSQTNEDCGYTLTYGSSAHPDALTSRASACSGSMLAISYSYDRDGRVGTETWPSDSSGTPSYQMSMGGGPDGPSSALDSVYKSVNLNGATYGYFYDAFNRRRAKQYPLGMEDEFYYRSDNLLMTDLGNDSTVTVNAHPIDEYVWLDGRPLVLLRQKLDASYARQADVEGGDCTRNGQLQSCGTFSIVTDHLGAPVVMIDSSQRVANEHSMEPFGAVNTVSLNSYTVSGTTHLAETAHPYTNGAPQTLADFTQPAWGGTATRFRIIFGMVDTAGTAAAPIDSVALVDGDTNASLSATTIGGSHAGRVISPWVSPSAGHVKAVFTSGSANGSYKGIVIEGYEFERFQATSTPARTALRYPGQYLDDETGIAQNWNSFLDARVGAYLEPEPMLQSTDYARRMAAEGHTVQVYAYARNNPMSVMDWNGLSPEERMQILAAYSSWLASQTESSQRLDAPGPITDFASALTLGDIKSCGAQADDLIADLSDLLNLQDYKMVYSPIDGWDGFLAHQWVYLYSYADNDQLVLDPFLGTAWSAPFFGTQSFTDTGWLHPQLPIPGGIWTPIFHRP